MKLFKRQSENRRQFFILFAILSVMILAAGVRNAGAQCVSLTTLGSASTQNFDTLSNTAGSTTNNLTIPGWFMTESGGGARDNEQYAVDTGASTTGDTFSYGAAAATDRALGQLRSGTLISIFGACYTNNTGSTITNLAVAYTGEEWRLGTAGRTDQMNFEYSTNATDLVTGTWTGVTALNFVTPDTATVGAKNGNAAADRTALASTISSLSIANGATFWIRWTDTDASGADDGLAVDDFSLTPNATPPINLTINDVSLNEGNAGTTSFTFTVSLSAPAGPGGVTFDIATADVTAVAPGDYTTKSLTSQTIPAGSSTYSFTVLVNGDTTPETNETFFVNVTNVTGATVTDGQGQGTIVNDDAAPNLTINDVSLNEGNAGTTTFTFTVSLSAPAPAGGVTFDIATADGAAVAPSDYTAKSLTSQTIPAGSSTYTFDVLVNGDTVPELDETFFVNVTNVTNAIATDGQGQGTIVNDDITKIHDVQGNGSATPIPGTTVTIEGIVTGNYQGTSKLQGFFLQEEDADVDADPSTSEGIFVFCNSCPTAVAEGQRVRVTGVVSEFNNNTEITAGTAGSVVVTNAGNNLAQITPSTIDLPIAGVVSDYYEAREGMKVTFIDTLAVSEYADLFRYGQISLYEGGRPQQYTETSAPSAAGYTAHLDNLSRRLVILDDENNAQQAPLSMPDGSQAVFYPRANGGFSVGTQGTDFFRGGDLVNGLTGILDWSSAAGVAGTEAWRIRPAAANPATFTVANPRPATPPAVGGSIKAVGMNLLNYFTTIDTTASNSTGPCGPSGTLDCRGADSVAELNRQRERASIVICTLNADVYGLIELENTTPSATITDLLGAVNSRCGGAHPFAFVNTGGTLGTDAIRVQIIYRTGVLSPVGSPLSDLDPVHSRPPTAQTFDVVDAANTAFGQRFTVIANHLRAKSCPGTGTDADAGDGQGCFNGTRTAQATRLLTWINSTVLPAAGDPDVLLLGDFNSYAKEDPVTTITNGGYTDLASALLGSGSYSFVFDGQLGHLDYAFSSASLIPRITGVGNWHINADESDLFDYNDEVKDAGEATFEEKPDGSALVPPRVVFQPASPYRASDHDPVLVGLFQSADLAITKTDTPDPVTAGTNLTYTITVTNNGPDAASSASFSDTLPAGTTFVSLPAVAGWTCTTPAVGTGGTVSCSNPSFAVGSAVFTLTVAVASSTAPGTVLSNTATVTSTAGDGNTSNNSATAMTTVAASADLSITKTDGVTTATPGGSVTYTITASNSGPSNATGATVADTFPASLTATWTCTGAGGGTCTASGSGNINQTVNLPTGGSVTYTVSATISAAATGTLSNTATVTAPAGVTDPTPGNNSATDSDTLSPSADLAITKTDGVTTATPGGSVTYTITASNAGPSNATGATVADTFPASLTATWTCTGAGGGTCTASGSGNINQTVNLPSGGSVTYTVSATISAAATGTLSNTATVTAPAGVTDPTPGNNSATDSDTLAASADLSITKTDGVTTATPGGSVTYTIVASNSGPSNATGATVADTFPASLTATWTCVGAGGGTCTASGSGNINNTVNLPSGGSVTYTVSATISAAATGTLSNTATVTAPAGVTDPTPGNNSATDSDTLAASADLAITKTDGVTTATPGGSVTYTITASNAGPSNATGATVADTFPASLTATWTCTGAGGGTCTASGSGNINQTVNLPSGGSVTYTVSATISASATGTLSNTATVTAPAGVTDPTPGNNSATDSDTLSPSADLSITKTDGVTTATPGGSVTYTIVASNAGPSNATGATVADTFPASLTTTWTCVGAGGGTCTASGSGNINNTVNLPTGGSVTFTVSATISAAATGTLSNTATVAAPAGVTDPTPGNNSATDTDTLSPQADLSITKTDGVTSVTAGGPVTYTIVASNAGPSNATGATVADTFPATLTGVTWTCTGASGGTCTASGSGNINQTVNLPSGGSVTFTVNATLSPAAVGTLSNTATVTAPAGVTDPTSANNSATDTDTIVLANADLAVIKTDSPDPVTAGNNIVYTIIVSNNGPGNATMATLTDALPANTTFQSITAPAGWTCTTPAVNAGGTVSCTNASLANGASGTFVLVVNVNTGTANGTISNTATVSTSVTDPVAGNNSSTATTTVAEFVSPAPTGQAPKALLVKPAAGNTTAGGGVSDSSCTAPTGVTVAGVFANINQALGAANTGDTIYVCPKYTANLVVPYIEQVSLGFTNLSVVGISDVRGSRAVIAANPLTATTPTTQLGTNYIVQIVATGVNFGNFVVDGAPGGTNFTGTGIFNGIAVRRSGAFVFNNTVQNIKTTDTATNANGQGIAVFGAGSAGSPLEAGTTASPVNILNNIVQTYRSNGVNVSAGSSSAYAFVRGNYIIGNGANSGTVNQTGVQFQAGANGDVFNNRITRILDSVAGCTAAAFSNCSAGIRLNTTSSSSTSNLRVRFNLISNTQTGIFAQDVQYVSMTNNTISHSVIDGINLRGSLFNLGSNFNTINQNTIFAARRAGVFIGLVGGDASLGNSLTQNTIEDAFTGVANNTPAGNNTIPTTGATANTFISVNNFVGSASSGVNDVQNTNPLP